MPLACESGALLMLCESNLFYMPKACPYKLMEALSLRTVEFLAPEIRLLPKKVLQNCGKSLPLQPGKCYTASSP